MLSVKKHQGTTNKSYLYLSGWMVAALRSEFGPLPDQSMHEKTSVSALIEELYTFLRQADARELGDLFHKLDDAKKNGGDVAAIQAEIDNQKMKITLITAKEEKIDKKMKTKKTKKEETKDEKST